MERPEIHKRTYGLPTRLLSRDSNASLSDTAEKPATPAEEQSSWLPHEMCATCGAPVKTSNLYCSEACRDREQRTALHESMVTSSASQFSPTKALPGKSNSAPATTLLGPKDEATNGAQDEQRFKYHCPQSPSLVAHRKTYVNGLRARAQQPAQSLTAFERELLAQRPHAPRAPDSAASSNEEDSSANERRGSATSSVSSASSVVTDPSTPSPNLFARGNAAFHDKDGNGSAFDVETAIDDEDINVSEFRLPPAITPSSTTTMRNFGASPAKPSRYTERHASDPCSLTSRSSPSSASPPYTEHTRPAAQPTMSYARRPSCTNLPAPVLYSPALTAHPAPAKHSPVQAMRRKSLRNGPVTLSGSASAASARWAANMHQRGPSASDAQSFAADAMRIAAAAAGSPTQDGTGHPADVAAATQSARRSSLASVGLGNLAQDTRSGENSMRRSVSDPVPASSPPADGAGSASSSAGRTLKARSPGQQTSPSALCGRPGCSGLTQSTQGPSSTPHAQASPSPKSMIQSRANQVRPVSRHRHTHSARARFDVNDNTAVGAAKGLSMTTRAQTLPGQSHEHMVGVPPSEAIIKEHAAEETADTSEEDRQPALHGRGRSKARGCRSVSRRSRSPPRAAARGRSRALHVEEIDRKGRIADSPPSVEAVLPSSVSPITIGRKSTIAPASRDNGSPSDRDADNESSPRRGRSPVERRGRLNGNAKLGAPLTAQTQQGGSGVATPFRERHQSLQPVQSGRTDTASVDPGFDDVEDLDFEL